MAQKGGVGKENRKTPEESRIHEKIGPREVKGGYTEFFDSPHREKLIRELIDPLKLPELNLDVPVLEDGRRRVRELVGDKESASKTAKHIVDVINTSGGVDCYFGSKEQNILELDGQLSLKPVSMYSINDRIMGFELQFGDSVIARVSFNFYYDMNPVLPGVEFFYTVNPKFRGMGLAGWMVDFAEELANGLDYGFMIEKPIHPASFYDSIKRGFVPVTRGKPIFDHIGVHFEYDSGRIKEIDAIKTTAERIGDKHERQEFCARRFAESFCKKDRRDRKVWYVPETYYVKTFSEIPQVGNYLDRTVRSTPGLDWEGYTSQFIQHYSSIYGEEEAFDRLSRHTADLRQASKRK